VDRAALAAVAGRARYPALLDSAFTGG
jgi:hypothetical protein